MHKEIRNSVVWLFFAFFVLATAIWQAQVSAAKDLVEKQRTLPPPRKTKHAIRPAPKEFTGDVVADYVAGCGKGMTDREIGWILEDFHNAGLDFDGRNPTDERHFAMRPAKHRWYHQTLVETLHLTLGQSAQAASKLAELFEQAKAAHIVYPEKGGEPYNAQGTLPFPSEEQLEADQDPFGSSIAIAYQPWNLCPLTPPQKIITWEVKFEQSAKAMAAEWENIDSAVINPPVETPRNLEGADSVFPFLRNQRFVSQPEQMRWDKGKLLSNIRALHPGQLKILLLVRPDLAEEIQTAMAKKQPAK